MSKIKDTMPKQIEVDDSGYSKGDIYFKLLEFQKLGIKVSKSSNNPHFKNDYADLNEVNDKVKGPLSELGVIIMPGISAEGVSTTLWNLEDGTSITSFLAFHDRSNPQKLGSEITYYRRYQLKAMLNLEEEDDDGEKASESKVGEAVRNLAAQKEDYQDDDLGF